MTPPSEPTTVSEADWNTTSECEVEEQQAQGTPPNGQTIYRASKKLAESSKFFGFGLNPVSPATGRYRS
jgi:hypothetical protein